ncbi:unnamed protein product [Adineta ricciae]|uniref:Uncharacterized protein n=2 Tax=Adineta ricciae TaxID=249248 RepID=A0A815WKA2_ADIRI|nr:unnamed protein product [Adineta ricciae]
MQLNVFEDLLKLETQVSMEYLPTNFNHVDNFRRPNLYSPIVQDQLAVELKQKQFKNIQEAKRAWLDIYVNIYEVQYQEYDQHYQKEFNQFQVISLNDGQKYGVDLFNSFMTYINHRTDRIKQEIYSEKILIYRRKLVRRRRRHHHHQEDLRSKKSPFIRVAAKIIIDLIRHPFTTTEINYLSRLNQSSLRPAHQREKQIQQCLTKIIDRLKQFFAKMENYPKIPVTSPLYKFYSDQLRTYFTHCNMTPLSLTDQLRARRELKLVKSIRRKLKKYKLVLRKTDKISVFHIGCAVDYKRKAADYPITTQAYEELNTNPFNQTIYDVTYQLNQLKIDRKISESQRLQMVPNRATTELSYMYNLPKSHKAMIILNSKERHFDTS